MPARRTHRGAWLQGHNDEEVPMPTRRMNNDAMINEFAAAWSELERAAVAEAEAWAELERAVEAARRPARAMTGALITAGKTVAR